MFAVPGLQLHLLLSTRRNEWDSTGAMADNPGLESRNLFRRQSTCRKIALCHAWHAGIKVSCCFKNQEWSWQIVPMCSQMLASHQNTLCSLAKLRVPQLSLCREVSYHAVMLILGYLSLQLPWYSQSNQRRCNRYSDMRGRMTKTYDSRLELHVAAVHLKSYVQAQ